METISWLTGIQEHLFDAMQSSADEFHQEKVRGEASDSLEEVVKLRLRVRAEDRRLDAQALVEAQDGLGRLEIEAASNTPDESAEEPEWMLLDAPGAG